MPSFSILSLFSCCCGRKRPTAVSPKPAVETTPLLIRKKSPLETIFDNHARDTFFLTFYNGSKPVLGDDRSIFQIDSASITKVVDNVLTFKSVSKGTEGANTGTLRIDANKQPERFHFKGKIIKHVGSSSCMVRVLHSLQFVTEPPTLQDSDKETTITFTLLGDDKVTGNSTICNGIQATHLTLTVAKWTSIPL